MTLPVSNWMFLSVKMVKKRVKKMPLNVPFGCRRQAKTSLMPVQRLKLTCQRYSELRCSGSERQAGWSVFILDVDFLLCNKNVRMSSMIGESLQSEENWFVQSVGIWKVLPDLCSTTVSKHLTIRDFRQGRGLNFSHIFVKWSMLL